MKNNTPGIKGTTFFMTFHRDWFKQIQEDMITVKPDSDGWIYEGPVDKVEEMVKEYIKLGGDINNIKIIVTDNQEVKK